LTALTRVLRTINKLGRHAVAVLLEPEATEAQGAEDRVPHNDVATSLAEIVGDGLAG
jgi:hypothetical protein